MTYSECERLQVEVERLTTVLAECKKELMGWHMIGDTRHYPECEQPYDWDKVDEYYDDFERRWKTKHV